MKRSDAKPKYFPPKIVELTNFSAVGDNLSSPMGACKSGANPSYSCVAGPDVLPQCSSGTTPDTSACGGGGYHTFPTCDSGTSAATICISGNGQQ